MALDASLSVIKPMLSDHCNSSVHVNPLQRRGTGSELSSGLLVFESGKVSLKLHAVAHGWYYLVFLAARSRAASCVALPPITYTCLQLQQEP